MPAPAPDSFSPYPIRIATSGVHSQERQAGFPGIELLLRSETFGSPAHWAGYYCSALDVLENTLFALDPTSRIVPTTSTRITASITAYSAMSCPSSSAHNLRSVFIISSIETSRLHCRPARRGQLPSTIVFPVVGWK